MSLYGSSNSSPGINISQLLALLSAGGSGYGRPLPNAAPAFGSGNGGSYGSGVTPANFGGGAMMPQGSGASGSGNNMSQMLPLLMAMSKNNGSSSAGGGGKGGLGSLFSGKGGPNNANSDLIGEFTAPGNQAALDAAFGSYGL